MPYWECKRVVYDELGAVGVQSAGVATPLVEREGKRYRPMVGSPVTAMPML